MSAAALPRTGSDDGSILDAFVGWVGSRKLTLYEAQEEAVMALLDDRHVILSTPTGSGKSLVATALLYRTLCHGQKGYYTCPVKALVNEKFFDLCEILGPENVGLQTGDAAVNPGAPIQCVTAEVLSTLCVRNATAPGAVVMDEFHYYADKERGIAWQIPLISLPKTQFLLMSATLGDMSRITQALGAFSGRTVVTVGGMTRPVPLHFDYSESALQETIAELVRLDRAPIYLVNFTQRECAAQAQNLTSIDLCTRDEKKAIAEVLKKERFPTPYGKEVQRLLKVGIGIHHGGLLPRYRRLVERLAQTGMLKVVSGTDTLGVGVNIPIRSVLFTQLCKFDGVKDGILPVREFHQIAGRAGRRGFDDQGFVVAQAPAHVIENRKSAAKGKKFVPKSPPAKGYVAWDRGTFERLQSGTPEPLESRFAINHGLLLAALQANETNPRRGAGYRRLLDLIARSHETPGSQRRLKRIAAQQFRVLRRSQIVELRRDEKARNPYPAAHEDLQRDFSLDNTLGLYVVETLPMLDLLQPPSPVENALNVLSLVEAIVENPRPILIAQQDREKGIVINELKARGVEYEERMQELEKVEWPKPNRDFIYETFGAFEDKHPWVGNDNIAPKGIAHELCERNIGFNDLVRDLEIARSEGVLLRYLSSVVRTLVRGVPAQYRDEAVDDLIAYLETAVRIVDASLLEEWQVLTGQIVEAPVVTDAPQRRLSGVQALRNNPRALATRIRAELNQFVLAIGRQDYTEALEHVLPDDELGEAWTPERLAALCKPFFTQHGALDTRPAARAPAHTRITEVNAERREVSQTLFSQNGDPEDADWAVFASVDLSDAGRAGSADDDPIVRLVRVGV